MKALSLAALLLAVAAAEGRPLVAEWAHRSLTLPKGAWELGLRVGTSADGPTVFESSRRGFSPWGGMVVRAGLSDAVEWTLPALFTLAYQPFGEPLPELAFHVGLTGVGYGNSAGLILGSATGLELRGVASESFGWRVGASVRTWAMLGTGVVSVNGTVRASMLWSLHERWSIGFPVSFDAGTVFGAPTAAGSDLLVIGSIDELPVVTWHVSQRFDLGLHAAIGYNRFDSRVFAGISVTCFLGQPRRFVTSEAPE